MTFNVFPPVIISQTCARPETQLPALHSTATSGAVELQQGQRLAAASRLERMESIPPTATTHRIHGAAIYGNIYHQYTPVMLAYIYQHHGSNGICI